MNATNEHSYSIEDLKKRLGKRVLVFVGMMGSGKTAIGRMVASSFSIPFTDSDHEIAAAANMEIPEIFEKHGEAYFRSGEERVIKRLLSEGPCVLSLGGGAFCSEATRQEIAAHAVSIWLTADIDLLLARVMKRPGTRPLLNVPDPRAKLDELIKEREPVYAQADLHVPSSKASKTQTHKNVLEALDRFI